MSMSLILKNKIIIIIIRGSVAIRSNQFKPQSTKPLKVTASTIQSRKCNHTEDFQHINFVDCHEHLSLTNHIYIYIYIHI